MTDIWVELSPNVRVSCGLTEYLAMNERGLARFYRQHIFGAGRKEAKAWAATQARERERSVTGEQR